MWKPNPDQGQKRDAWSWEMFCLEALKDMNSLGSHGNTIGEFIYDFGFMNYEVLSVIGGFANGTYWSSSEFSDVLTVRGF